MADVYWFRVHPVIDLVAVVAMYYHPDGQFRGAEVLDPAPAGLSLPTVSRLETGAGHL
ncbi:MAG: hypothetical protein ACRDSL_20965 [Pseudonocardiaceae bacterium]